MSFEYDIAVSFAGENRTFVKNLVDTIHKYNKNIKIFYDELKQVTLWGKDLYQYLSGIYTKQAKYCIIFVSEDYIKKSWTKLELQSAQARAFSQDTEYILPIRLDDTQLPGLPETIGYLDSRHIPIETIAQMIIEKVNFKIENTLQTSNIPKKKPLVIRNYIYLDKNLVENIYTQIEDNNISNTPITDTKKFNNLYETLKEENLLNSYTELNDENWNTIENNSFLEIQGNARFSQLNQIANMSAAAIKLTQQFNLPVNDKDAEAFHGFQGLNEDIENNGTPIIFKTNASLNYQIVSYLNKEYIIGSQNDFEGINLKMLCRIKRIVPKNENLKIVDISEKIKLPKENREARRKRMKNNTTLPSEVQESISGPCILAIPIAIYN